MPQKLAAGISPGNFEFVQISLLINLITLHDFLILNNANFIIHNLMQDYHIDKYLPFSQNVELEITKRPRLLNFLDNSLHGLMTKNGILGFDHKEYGADAHPGEDGHEMYADFLEPHIRNYLAQ